MDALILTTADRDEMLFRAALPQPRAVDRGVQRGARALGRELRRGLERVNFGYILLWTRRMAAPTTSRCAPSTTPPRPCTTRSRRGASRSAAGAPSAPDVCVFAQRRGRAASTARAVSRRPTPYIPDDFFTRYTCRSACTSPRVARPRTRAARQAGRPACWLRAYTGSASSARRVLSGEGRAGRGRVGRGRAGDEDDADLHVPPADRACVGANRRVPPLRRRAGTMSDNDHHRTHSPLMPCALFACCRPLARSRARRLSRSSSGAAGSDEDASPAEDVLDDAALDERAAARRGRRRRRRHGRRR